MPKDKAPTHEEALMLVYEYRERDGRVVALAKAYSQMISAREICGEQWDKLDKALAVLKRNFKPEDK